MTWYFATTEATITKDEHTFTVPWDAYILSDATLELFRSWLPERRVAIVKVQPATDVSFDLPGMICTDRPWSAVALDDMTLSIPCEDIESFVRILREAPAEDIGMTIYSLRGFLRWLIMTAAERDQMIVALEAISRDAHERAVGFWKDRESPAAMLRAANAHSLGIDESELPEIGGRDMEEFK